MAKTKPIGVRFDEELLNSLKEADIVSSPQKALNLYEETYLKSVTEKIAENNKPENKAKIEAERNGTANSTKKEHKQPFTPLEVFVAPPINNGKNELDDWHRKQIEERIANIEAELKKPPSNPIIGLRRWKEVRWSELEKLKKELANYAE